MGVVIYRTFMLDIVYFKKREETHEIADHGAVISAKHATRKTISTVCGLSTKQAHRQADRIEDDTLS